MLPAGKEASSPLSLLKRNAVPVLFAVLCTLGVIVAEIDPLFLVNEIIARLARNSFLILSLLIPVSAGLGLNFGPWSVRSPWLLSWGIWLAWS